MPEKTVVDVPEMCAVEKQVGAVQSVSSLAIGSIIDDVLDEGIVAGQVHKAAIGAVVHPVMIQAVTDALQKEDLFLGSVAPFVPSYVEK